MDAIADVVAVAVVTVAAAAPVVVVIGVDVDPDDDVASVVVTDVSGEPVPCMWFEQSYLNDIQIITLIAIQYFAYKINNPWPVLKRIDVQFECENTLV